MNIFEDIVITNLYRPLVVHSEKGRKSQMTDRKSYGLSLCISGQITYTMNGKTYVSDQTNAVILPQGGNYRLAGDREGLFPVVNFKCENFNCREITILPLEDPESCIQSFQRLNDLFLHGESRLNKYSCFYQLLSSLSSPHPHRRTPLDPVVRYIAENMQDPDLSNTELAGLIGISEVYLRKLFLACYHTTPKQYILDLRIRKAQQLLRDTPLTVTAIAEACGFSSPYHFCRAFKQKTGRTPTQYATANRIYTL